VKTNPLPKDTDRLLTLAEDIAALLSEKSDELDLSVDLEALLRASIAAATFAIDTYLAAIANANKSPLAQSFLPEAKARCDRSIKQLRRRVSRSIGQLRRHVKHNDIMRIADYSVSRSS
jgi:hypothetical protein